MIKIFKKIILKNQSYTLLSSGVSALVHCIHLLVLVSSGLGLDQAVLWIVRRTYTMPVLHQAG